MKKCYCRRYRKMVKMAQEEQKREKPLSIVTMVKISIDFVKRVLIKRRVCEVIHFFKWDARGNKKDGFDAPPLW